jgi:hypothetical protein
MVRNDLACLNFESVTTALIFIRVTYDMTVRRIGGRKGYMRPNKS